MRTIIKIMAVLAVVACIVSVFSACGGEDDEEDTFSAIYKSVKIELGGSADSVIDKLGKPKSSGDAYDCGSGTKVMQYEYSGIIVCVLTDAKGKTTIDKIEFMDDSATTSKGIYIGKTSDDVIAAHGTPTEEKNGSIEYVKGDLHLKFTIASGEVKKITYQVITK